MAKAGLPPGLTHITVHADASETVKATSTFVHEIVRVILVDRNGEGLVVQQSSAHLADQLRAAAREYGVEDRLALVE